MGTVATLLAEHVSFRCTSVDRIGIRGYIPGSAVRGRDREVPPQPRQSHPLARCAQPQPRAAGRRVRRCSWPPSGVPVVRFKRGEYERGPRPPLSGRGVDGWCVTAAWCSSARLRSGPRRGGVSSTTPTPRIARAIPTIAWRRQSSVPDHWYLYFADAEWGPAFVKLCSYAPYPLWCCANGHEWAKRQFVKTDIGFTALDNGLCTVEDPAAAHRICARLGAGHVRDLLRRMMAVLPDPLTIDDRRAGFDWSFSIAQLEVSDTAVFDQPRRARAWFEAAISNHLDLGRPERVALVVNRTIVNRGKYKTPGRFATEVITRDVAPQLQIHYKSSKAKAYLKEGRALRVETTINNATDFAVHKTLNAENWQTLRRVGADTNARFLAALGEGQPGLPDPATLESVVLPSIHRRPTLLRACASATLAPWQERFERGGGWGTLLRDYEGAGHHVDVTDPHPTSRRQPGRAGHGRTSRAGQAGARRVARQGDRLPDRRLPRPCRGRQGQRLGGHHLGDGQPGGQPDRRHQDRGRVAGRDAAALVAGDRSAPLRGVAARDCLPPRRLRCQGHRSPHRLRRQCCHLRHRSRSARSPSPATRRRTRTATGRSPTSRPRSWTTPPVVG